MLGSSLGWVTGQSLGGLNAGWIGEAVLAVGGRLRPRRSRSRPAAAP